MDTEEKVRLFKIENDEISKKLHYLFCKENSANWERKYLISCAIKGIAPIEKGNLNDQEYFILTHPPQKNTENCEHYYLLVDNEPATYITLKLDIDHFVEITLSTSQKFLHQGYATKSVELIENMLFANHNIQGIKILDFLSVKEASSKIAEKLGFLQDEKDGQLFVKNNPNYINQNEQGQKM